MSPVKVSGASKHLDCWLKDESGRIRFVSFVPSKYDIFKDFARRSDTVSFSHVAIQENKIGKSMEVVIKKSSPLLRSPQKTQDVTTHLDALPATPRQIKLNELNSKSGPRSSTSEPRFWTCPISSSLSPILLLYAKVESLMKRRQSW